MAQESILDSSDYQPNVHLPNVVSGLSRFTDFDVHLFREGKHYSLYDKLGAHVMEHEGVSGTYFAVWAPNAEAVSVVGDFNGWHGDRHALHARWDQSGIWEGFVPGVGDGARYKYYVRSRYGGYAVQKGDPFARQWEEPPHTASVVRHTEHTWQDADWLKQRAKGDVLARPYSVYEVHLGSWRRVPEENNRSLSYRELAQELPAYCQEMGFTHVELLPVTEHPFYGSWGYQAIGYFAPTSRYGTPQDFMALVDALHQAGVGVILDWVPSHFPSDEHGLIYFDGTHLFEHADPRKGFHPDWKSYIFNLDRNEIRSFLISSALFWVDQCHIDGLRVDAVASMLYLDYSRKEGEWVPNEYGGRENLESIRFLREFNDAIAAQHPDVVTIAEESTAWPGVTQPTKQGGLGFTMKWMMGWMHDTLAYFHRDPIYRRHHQGEITFSIVYAFSERFMLPLSHDEVVYGKGPLIDKMPGDWWQKRANLRALYGYMYTHPGAKLLFMGGEFAQAQEWKHDYSLDWHLTGREDHAGVARLMQDLNALYREEKALYEQQFSPEGFAWIDLNDAQNSVLSYLRRGTDPADYLVVVCNLTPAVRANYRVGVPDRGTYAVALNTDDGRYGGSHVFSEGLTTYPVPMHGHGQSLLLTLPPLSTLVLRFSEG